MQNEWTIGRSSGCDIVVSDSSVSSRHCRLFRCGDVWMLEDLGSSNGTFVNGTRITSPAAVSATDNVTLGLTARLIWPEDLFSQKTTEKQRQSGDGVPPTLVIQNNEIVLGRDPTCDYPLDYPMISRRHARLMRTQSGVLVEDLASSNGTFVNGKLITAATLINVGDVVSLGSYELRLNKQGALEEFDLRGKLSVEANSVTVSVRGKILIEDISLTIHPGEFVGLMGPAGAGKTTLMSALNGYVPPTHGEVFFNGYSLYGNYSQYATRIGYVPQDDIMHRDLTVGEALHYTARLRLPEDYTNEDISERIRVLLDQFGLAGVHDVLIGSAEKKGISGGQRKRVNLAMELLTDPLVLFLDEPTSGLSSEDALVVMKLLRSLADSGKTILLTIHQPGLEVFRLLDKLVIVSKDKGSVAPGKLVYYGPAYPGAVNFFNPDRVWPPGIDPSPDEVLRGLGARSTEEWIRRFNQSEFHDRYVNGRASSPSLRKTSEDCPSTEKSLKEFGSQLSTLAMRCFAIKARDLSNTCILLAQAPVVALLIVMTFGKRSAQDASIDLKVWTEVSSTLPVALFVLVLSCLWFGCSNSVREIVGEWAIYRRERMVNLRIPAYVASKFAVLGLLSAVQCFVLLLIVNAGCGLQGSSFTHYLSLLLISLVGVGIGLVVSAAARTSEAAVAILPLALLPMVMLGGVMMPIHDLPEIAKPLANLMPSRWGFEALLENESARQKHSPPAPVDTGAASRDMAEEFFPEAEGRSGTVASLLVLLLMAGALYTGTHVILWKRDLH